jgi:hypothetical protein
MTEADGEALLMLYHAVFLAKIFPSRAKGLASMDRAVVCGPTWFESFATYDPRSREWKTPQLGELTTVI